MIQSARHSRLGSLLLLMLDVLPSSACLLCFILCLWSFPSPSFPCRLTSPRLLPELGYSLHGFQCGSRASSTDLIWDGGIGAQPPPSWLVSQESPSSLWFRCATLHPPSSRTDASTARNRCPGGRKIRWWTLRVTLHVSFPSVGPACRLIPAFLACTLPVASTCGTLAATEIAVTLHPRAQLVDVVRRVTLRSQALHYWRSTATVLGDAHGLAPFLLWRRLTNCLEGHSGRPQVRSARPVALESAEWVLSRQVANPLLPVQLLTDSLLPASMAKC